MAWRGVAWRGVAWRGVAWRGVAWRGVALRACVCQPRLVTETFERNKETRLWHCTSSRSYQVSYSAGSQLLVAHRASQSHSLTAITKSAGSQLSLTTRSHSHSHSLTQSHSLTLTHSHALTHSLTRTHSLTHSHALTRTRTLTRTHTRSLSLTFETDTLSHPLSTALTLTATRSYSPTRSPTTPSPHRSTASARWTTRLEVRLKVIGNRGLQHSENSMRPSVRE